MNAAFKLFLQKGYKEVTMNEILKESGLSRGSFYYYFKSKEQVYAETLEMFLVAIPATLQRPIDDSSLFAFYHDYLANASLAYAQIGKVIKEAQVPISNFFSLSLDAMKRLPEYKSKVMMINDVTIKVWVNVIEKARKNGEITTSMTDLQIAYFFKYTMEGMGIKSEMEGRSSEANDKELIELWDSFYMQITS